MCVRSTLLWRFRVPRTTRVPCAVRAGVGLLVLAMALVAAAGCGTAASTGDTAGAVELRVFAAAGLTEAFTELGEQFSAAHPHTTVTFNFAGGPTLVAQISQGAPLDVFAIADTDNMDKVATVMGESRVFARNRMAIIVEPGNPEDVSGLGDLSDENLKVVLGDPALPAGKCAEAILSRQGITVSPVSLEENVKSIVTKVSLGEADAGMAWVSEIVAHAGKVEGVAIPDDQNVVESFPIAIAQDSKYADEAQAFVDFVFSAAGQKVLASCGFMPPR